MPHPDGGQGDFFKYIHSFSKAYEFIGENGFTFESSTGEKIKANRSKARNKITLTIVFVGENSRHGNVCNACWGYGKNCSGTRINHCSAPLDKLIP